MITAFCTDCGAQQTPGFASRGCAPEAGGAWAHGAAAGVAHVAVGLDVACQVCGGEGRALAPGTNVCPRCRALRPLEGGRAPPVEAFIWRLDAEAMLRLQSLGPLTQAVHAITAKVGRPWFEAAVDGVCISERQFPDIFAEGVRAARLLGLVQMPGLYVAGQDFWGVRTLGTYDDAFVVIGAAIVTAPRDIVAFLLAREMGRIRAGHAVWRTAFELLAGPASVNGALAGQGLIQALSPARAMQTMIQAPLAAWARHAEITADRAGCLAVGDLALVRRAVLTAHLRSPMVAAMMDMDDWERQEDESERAEIGLAEAAFSATPFLNRRLKLARSYMAEPIFQQWRDAMAPRPQTPQEERLQLSCPHCATPMRVARALFAAAKPFAVRCPSAACGEVFSIRPKAKTPELAE